MGKWGPLNIAVVRGRSVAIRGRTLTPVARVVSAFGHRGTIRRARVEGSGRGVVHIQPLAVVETSNDTDRLFPIRDLTREVLLQMAIVALIVPLVAIALIAASRRTD